MSTSDAMRLAPGPRAVSRARAFLRQAFAGTDPDLHATAELLTCELVTNVLLHTTSAVTLRVQMRGRQARVEVEDDSPVLPAAGILDVTAASGRGLVLVDRLSQQWGARRVHRGGKTVWFELEAGAPTPFESLDADELLHMWAPESAQGGAGQDGTDERRLRAGREEQPVRRVRLEGIRTELLNATKSHLDDLVRDLALATAAPHAGDHGDDDVLALGVRLRALAVDLLEFRNEIRRQALDAAHRQAPTLTLEMVLPLSLRPRLLEYRDVLDLADELCASDRLLLAPAPPEHVEFRRWKLTTIAAQLSE